MRKAKFLGVHSRAKQGAKGAGKTFYYAWAASPSEYAVQELDAALTPKSAVMPVAADVFRHSFRLEPSILAMPVTTPDFSRLKPGSPDAKKGSPAKKADQPARARQLEDDMRNNFRKAISALARPRDRQGALAALEQLVRLKKGIIPAHKHMFRDFGVSLRKKKLFNLALESALRVLELAPDDDHAHFNAARIYALLGVDKKAVAHLERAIGIDPGVPYYHRLLAHVRGGKGGRR